MDILILDIVALVSFGLIFRNIKGYPFLLLILSEGMSIGRYNVGWLVVFAWVLFTNKRANVWVYSIALLSLVLGFISRTNDTSLFNFFGKPVLIFCSLFILRSESVVVGKIGTNQYLLFLLVCSIHWSLATQLLSSNINIGISNTYRYSGCFYDPNFFGFLQILFYIQGSLRSRSIVLIILLLTQSMSVIFLFLVYRILPLGRMARRISIFLPFIGVLGVFYLKSKFTIDFIVDYDSFWDVRLNSLFRRLDSSFRGIEDLLNSRIYFLSGFGSGIAKIRYGHVFHNGWLQLLYDNGIVIFIAFIMVLMRVSKQLSGRGLLVFFMFTFMFDPLWNASLLLIKKFSKYE